MSNPAWATLGGVESKIEKASRGMLEAAFSNIVNPIIVRVVDARQIGALAAPERGSYSLSNMPYPRTSSRDGTAKRS
jgi:hypothetical protein